MTALEPCPHCGNAHNEYQDYGFQHWISCPSCEMLGPDSPSEEEAAAAWNALPRPSDVTALKARAEAAEAERDRLAGRVTELEALTGPQRDRLVELERELEATKLSACNGTPCSIFTEDHLVFSARQALARTAPAADPETGAPVSLGWRIRWLCDRVASLESQAAALYIEAVARERARVIGCIEEVTGRRVSDDGQYRADISSSLKAWKKEAAAAPVEWREGVPSVADVRAHEERGGLWVFRIKEEEGPPDTPDFDELLVIDERNQHPSRVPDVPFVASLSAKLERPKPGEPEWPVLDLSAHPMCHFVYEFRPVDVDGTPVPWPVHPSEAPDDIDPVAMIEADAKFDRMGIVEVADGE